MNKKNNFKLFFIYLCSYKIHYNIMNEKLIKDLREGRCALRNDGIPGEVWKVLKYAFPNCKKRIDLSDYFMSAFNGIDWSSHFGIYLITYIPEDFISSKTTIKRINERDDIIIYLDSSEEIDILVGNGLQLNTEYRLNGVYYPFKGLYNNTSYSAFLRGYDTDSVKYTKITYSDIISTFPLKLPYKTAQSIIDIACASLKEKLAGKWGSDIVQGKPIDITEEDYNTMYAACTPKQKELFDKIFKQTKLNKHFYYT